MRGLLVIVIVLLALIVGGAILLSRSVEEQPVRTIEVDVVPSATQR
ncbi:MAG TPA: hypothetical protein VNI79_08415 [Sphingomicrobium sp.]|nr:hypothetical protein [Sphingomicrobium sp.]